MTCTVIITDKKTVILGGDSAGVAGLELRPRADEKVFRVGSYVIGFTTSFRMGQILRYGTHLPEPPAGADAAEMAGFLVTQLVPVVRQAFAGHGFSKTARFTSSSDPTVSEEGQEVGGLFLLGVAGQIFEIRQDYQVARPATRYSAIGHGAPVALGALHALEAFPELSLQERARRALEASEAYSAAVRGPFHFVELRHPTMALRTE
jgi:hypothetical protein